MDYQRLTCFLAIAPNDRRRARPEWHPSAVTPVRTCGPVSDLRNSPVLGSSVFGSCWYSSSRSPISASAHAGDQCFSCTYRSCCLSDVGWMDGSRTIRSSPCFQRISRRRPRRHSVRFMSLGSGIRKHHACSDDANTRNTCCVRSFPRINVSVILKMHVILSL
jgi:hypothetical protein